MTFNKTQPHYHTGIQGDDLRAGLIQMQRLVMASTLIKAITGHKSDSAFRRYNNDTIEELQGVVWHNQ